MECRQRLSENDWERFNNYDSILLLSSGDEYLPAIEEKFNFVKENESDDDSANALKIGGLFHFNIDEDLSVLIESLSYLTDKKEKWRTWTKGTYFIVTEI